MKNNKTKEVLKLKIETGHKGKERRDTYTVHQYMSCVFCPFSMSHLHIDIRALK